MFDAIFSKLNILAEAAKYDVSCSSSGSNRKQKSGGLGNAKMCGICHSFTADGRCISLLKTLMSNDCVFDCLYCGSRRSCDVKRASFTPKEICELTINFYKRNYIEGLFLSSAIEKSPEYTMQKLVDTVVMLRKDYNFNGYIHLKGIPSAPYQLILKGAEFADRMSFNIELPSQKSLQLLAPQKNKESIVRPMQSLAQIYCGQGKRKTLIPAGQTTQMIIGASPESDGQIIRLTQALYNNYRLKRVYYSSYIPINTTSSLLPVQKSKLIREHRLYQADWLLRFYGFDANELISEAENFSEQFDPKCWWALKNYQLFPLEINTAPIEMLLRVPGIGMVSAYKILNARKYCKLDFDDLKKMRVTLKRAKHFITCKGKFSGTDNSEFAIKRALLEGGEGQKQLSIFDSENALSALTGQL